MSQIINELHEIYGKSEVSKLYRLKLRVQAQPSQQLREEQLIHAELLKQFVLRYKESKPFWLCPIQASSRGNELIELLRNKKGFSRFYPP